MHNSGWEIVAHGPFMAPGGYVSGPRSPPSYVGTVCMFVTKKIVVESWPARILFYLESGPPKIFGSESGPLAKKFPDH